MRIRIPFALLALALAGAGALAPGCGSNAGESALPVVTVGEARSRALDDLEGELKGLDAELAIARRDIENVQQEVHRLRETLDAKFAHVAALQGRIERLRGAQSPEPGVARGGVERVKAASGFVFELLGCRRSGAKIHCDLRVTSRDRDRPLRITAREIGRYRWTRLFDNLNTPYDPVWMRLGDETTEAPAIGGRLKANEPVPLEFRFEGLLKRATSGSRLVLGCAVDQEPFTVEFDSIPFE